MRDLRRCLPLTLLCLLTAGCRPPEDPGVQALRQEVSALRAEVKALAAAQRALQDRLAAAAPATAEPAPPDGAEPAPPDGAEAAPGAGVTQLGPDQYRISRDALRRLVEGFRKNKLSMRLAPMRQGGAVSGLRLSDVPEGSPAYALGLRAGDELLKINGVQLSATSQLEQIRTRVRESREISFYLMRGGTPHTISVRVGR